MPSPSHPDSHPPESLQANGSEDLDESSFPPEEMTQALTELEDGVVALRQRYTEVAQAYSEKQELRVRLNRAQSELKRHRTQTLKDEVEALQTRLAEVELTLESELFSWSSLKEPFWMAVRFGGLGMVLGWVLHALR